ncbi:MAG: NTP transferase domain-containing protein [Actinomycetota bacterium]
MTNLPHRTTYVLLAAGAGERFFGPVHKLLAPIRGVPVLTLSVRAMTEAGGGECTVVLGADTSAGILEALEGCATVTNPDWRTGQRSSVLCAIAHARQSGADQVVIGLGDQPFVGAGSWRAVAQADAPIAVAVHHGRRGNPVKLRSDVWDLFESTGGDPDAGARTLMHVHPELVVEVACQGSSDDIDTREDLTKWI